jgi:hypothetical protein
LFDHNVNRLFKRYLTGHDIKTAREAGWDKLGNGMLLQAAADSSFDVMISIDKNIQHQQNLDTLPIAVIILDSYSNALPELIPFAPHVQSLLTQPLQKALYFVDRDGHVTQIQMPK